VRPRVERRLVELEVEADELLELAVELGASSSRLAARAGRDRARARAGRARAGVREAARARRLEREASWARARVELGRDCDNDEPLAELAADRRAER
jgi:hypothetical protein